MMTEQNSDASVRAKNLATARRFVQDVLGGHGEAALTLLDEIVAPDVRVSTGLKADGWIEGKETYRAVIATLQAAFPDMAVTVEEVLGVDGDPNRAVVRFRATNTHTGAMYGVAATGKAIPMDETHLMRFDPEGKLVENIVGANNPLGFEMLFADLLRPQVLPEIFKDIRLAPELARDCG